MYDILETIQKWREKEVPFAIATVVETWGSAPRKVGAMMAINDLGEFAGSVSGGCVESAVISESQKVISEKSSKLLEYGVSNHDAWDFGLACGGNIKIYSQYFTDAFYLVIDSLLTKTEISYSSVIDEKSSQGKINILPSPPEKIGLSKHANNRLIFKNSISPPLKIILIGGAQIAQHLSSLALSIGLDVIVIDPRKAFSAKTRFQDVKIINAWPDEVLKDIGISKTTAIVTLSHDPKIDDPALLSALDSNCFYIGALGSKKTHKERIERLQIKGIRPSQIERIKGPAGLKIGANTPEEIAVSILGEIVEYSHRK
ncbi:MAG: XdhC family protein [Chloroflexi bacterium]|jgi:xanthine dehydrogenase accessory factor|nr:XdhC family protein [Chloroflexota bacterium]MBT4003383.1 XdhC family protein [Chloroflexota bacterium]MBT4305922.1 XdhC family protein [Chloroflexota bacterium]MBT4533747.1 XdhC family protein [Chloroflexota bacterium]MBT4681610.1 XdhC family protein [Chloroflexota bacterium]